MTKLSPSTCDHVASRSSSGCGGSSRVATKSSDPSGVNAANTGVGNRQPASIGPPSITPASTPPSTKPASLLPPSPASAPASGGKPASSETPASTRPKRGPRSQRQEAATNNVAHRKMRTHAVSRDERRLARRVAAPSASRLPCVDDVVPGERCRLAVTSASPLTAVRRCARAKESRESLGSAARVVVAVATMRQRCTGALGEV